MEKESTTIWHLYSDGMRSDIPFGTEEAKCFAWNSIAICAWRENVTLLVITINDTHFHLLAEATPVRIGKFKDLLKQRLHRHMGKSDAIHLSCDRTDDRTSALARFMYVYRNCLDFYHKLPGEYPWGCGNIYFSEKRDFYKGTKIKNLSYRVFRSIFRTHYPLPAEWVCDEKGKILPECFIDIQRVETLFGSVRAFIAFLYVRKEDEMAMKQLINRNYLEHRSILDLRRMGNELSRRIHGRHLEKLSLEQRIGIAARMIRQGQAGKNASLAKALFLKPEDLQFLL